MGKKRMICIGKVFIVATLLPLLFLTLAQTAELKKLSLDDSSSLGTTIVTDTEKKFEGKGSIKISTLWPTTICLGEVSGLDVENATLIYEAMVKCEKLEGTAFLEVWCYVGGGQYFSRGMNSVVTDTMDWKKLQTPFILQKGQKVEKATLNVAINGKGTIWVDDVRLLKEPLDNTVSDIGKSEISTKKIIVSGTELLKDGGFETEKDGMPSEWGTWSWQDEKGVKFVRDTVIKHTGEASASIINTDTDPEQKKLPQWVQHVEYDLPYGQKVVLTGWVKTEEANAAAVCMRCDGQEKQLAFATTWNFKGPFKGTMDWTPFEISFEVPEGTQYIRIMPFVAGPGKAWFDDLSLKVK